MSNREVMQQALDALTDCWTEYYQHTSPRTGQWVLDAIEALRAELAKPAPVAVPDGWWLAPVKMTPEMKKACDDERGPMTAWKAWEVFKATAPQPPALAVDVEAVREVEKSDSICMESDGCPTENAVLKRDWRNMTAHIAKLQAAPDEARKDAERYRWLRDVECFVWPSIKRVELDEASSVSLWIQPDVAMDSEGIDAAIDAAMERQS